MGNFSKIKNIAIITILVIFFLSVPKPSQSQESELKKADSLILQSNQLYQAGRYAEAIPLDKEVLAIYENVLGPVHPDVATALNDLALLYQSLGDNTKAEPLYKRSLIIYENTLGPENIEVAATLNNLAELYRSLGNFVKAEPLYQRSLTIKEKALGFEHPDVATTLNNLAVLYTSLGEYAKAEPLYQRSLAIYEKALGPDHPKVAMSLDNLAVLYSHLGEYTKAEPLYAGSLAIRMKALGPYHSDVATSLNNLAALYFNLGEYAKAELLYQRSLANFEKSLGPVHPVVAQLLTNLADLYRLLGEYAKAEPLLQRSLTISMKAFGPEHLDVARNLGQIGQLYTSLGEYAKAELLFQQSLATFEKALGPEHPDVATALNDLAVLYQSLGDYTKAEPLLQRSLAIYEKAFGPEHPNVATTLDNLALVYDFLGEYAKAEPLLQRSLTISMKAFGPEHPNVATSMAHLAFLYNLSGEYAKVEPLYQRSLAIYEKAFGPEHPNVATILDNLALFYAQRGEFNLAHRFNMQTQEIDGKLIDQVMGFTSEDRKLKFLATKKLNLHGTLSLVSRHLIENSMARKDALNIWLRRKGIILEVQKRFQEALVFSDKPTVKETFQELSRVRSSLSRLTFAGPGNEGPETYKKKADNLKIEKDKLEAKLSRINQAFALQQKIAKADCEKVATALPLNSVLIEFARVEMFDFKAKGKEPRWKPAHYLVFLLHSGKKDRVDLVDLGDADKIDKAVFRFKKEISNLSALKSAKIIQSSKMIYNFVFEPLRKELGDVKKIFLSPDGNLNLIPFELFQGPDGKYLIEDYTFNYLAAGRDILGFGQIKAQRQKTLLVGDPDFDMGTDEKGSILRKLGLVKVKQKGIVKRSSSMGKFNFTRLPGTKQEVMAIYNLLGKEKAQLYTGKKAIEEVLSQDHAPRILHLATHGFFLNDQDLSELMDDNMFRGISILPKPGSNRIKIENPLLRSGIALAGANNALKSNDSDNNTGIVTAEKILGLRLRGTEMVVLSACDTGIGEVKAGEGVFGLRRAFTQAGAKSLVMSMWSVPDKETKELMVEFYSNILSGKMNRCQALRRAALKEMKIVKKRCGHANPFYWGAFVFMGEP